MSNSSSTTRVTPPGQPAPGSHACLVGIYPAGPGMGCLYEIQATPLLIGRDEDCDICLPDQAVSRRHARIQPAVDGIYVVDLGSRNGSFVNEVGVDKHRLQDGDYLRVGGTILRFLDRDNIETAYHEEIYQLAIVDALTEVYNRRYLLEFLDQEHARSTRHQRPLALVLADVDRFKAINDRFGHLGGDAALHELAHLLRRRVRAGDLLARYGGEEFALVLIEATRDEAGRVAEDLRRLVEEHVFTYGDQSYQLTISLGVGSSPADQPLTPVELLRQADQKLFEAKHTGRNRTVV